MSRMERDEAEALAHLAHVETGLEASTEPGDGVNWVVVVRDGTQVERFEDAALYPPWRDRRLGIPAQVDQAGKAGATLHNLGWALGGFLDLLAQAVAALSLRSKRTNVDTDQKQSRGYSHRLTRPPNARR